MAVRQRLEKIHRRLKRLDRKRSKRRKAKQAQGLQYGNLEPRRVLNAVPIAQPDRLYYTAVDTNLFVESGGLLDNDYDLEQDSLGIVGGSTDKRAVNFSQTAQGGSLVAFADGNFNYYPPTGFAGIDSFTYQAEDGNDSSPVTAVNIAVGTPLSAQLNASDYASESLLHSGILQTRQPLGGGLQLNYRSDSIPTPIVAVETQLLPGAAIPDSISVVTAIGGVTGETTQYDTEGLANEETIRFVQRVVAPSLATGVHDWTMTVTLHYDGASDVAQEFTGQQTIINRTDSEFGAGWWLDGYDRLIPSGDGALLVNADGSTLNFPFDGTSYDRAAGDPTYSTLVDTGNGFTLTDKWGDERRFDASGRMIAVKRLNNLVDEFTYAYDGDLLQTITDQFGRTYDFSYDAAGQLQNVNDFAHRNTTVEIDARGVLTQVVVADEIAAFYTAPQWQFDYVKIGGQEYLSRVTDPELGSTEYDYKLSTRRLRKITNPDQVEFKLYPSLTQGYAGAGQARLFAASEVDARYVDDGEVTRFRTDAAGNTTYLQTPSGTVATYDYDLTGHVVRFSEAASPTATPQVITEVGYSEIGNPVLVINNDGTIERGLFDANVNKVSQWTVEDLNTGVSTTETFSYDAQGNLQQFESADGEIWDYQYDSHGNLTVETQQDPDGAGPLQPVVTQYGHDVANYNLVTSIEIDGQVIRTIEYTPSDQPRIIFDGAGNYRQFIYDLNDTVTQVYQNSETNVTVPFEFGHTIATDNQDTHSIYKSLVTLGGFQGPISVRPDAEFESSLGGSAGAQALINEHQSSAHVAFTCIILYDDNGDPIPNRCEDTPPPPPPPPPPPICIPCESENVVFFGTTQHVGEEGDTFQITVELYRAFADAEVSVEIGASGDAKLGQDFILSSPIVVFGPYEQSKTIDVQLRNDSLLEGDEDFELHLVNPFNAFLGSPRRFDGTILDVPPDDGGSMGGSGQDPPVEDLPVVQFLSTSASGVEDSLIEIMVGISAAPTETVVVNIDASMAGHSASNQLDFSLQTPVVVFEPSDFAPQSVFVNLFPDEIEEGFESFGLEITPAINAEVADDGSAYFVGLIEDVYDDGSGGPVGGDGPAVVYLAPTVRTEAEGKTINVVAHLTQALTSDLTVTLESVAATVPEAVSGFDFQVSNPALTFVIAAGMTTGVFPIQLLTDSQQEPDEHFAFRIATATQGGPLNEDLVIDDTPLETTITDVFVNAAPYFTSTPQTDAYVGSEYRYVSTGTDAEGDSLSYAPGRITYPNGYDPGPANDIQFEYFDEGTPNQYGIYTWSPPAELAGQIVTLEEIVWDGINDPVSRSFDIYVRPTIGNSAPNIVSTPDEAYQIPLEISAEDLGPNFNPDYPQFVDTEFINLNLATGEQIQVDVSLNRDLNQLSANIVFALDFSGSMDGTIDWLTGVGSGGAGAISQIETQLMGLGFTNNQYGLIVFGHDYNFVENVGGGQAVVLDSILGRPVTIPVGLADPLVTNVHPFELPSPSTSAELFGSADKLIALLQGIEPAGGAEYGQAAIARLFSDNPTQESTYLPDQLPYAFPANSVTSIVLATNQSTVGYEEQVQQDILSNLINSEETTVDDILFTSLSLSRLTGDDGNDGLSQYITSSSAWTTDDRNLIVQADDEAFVAVFDVAEYDATSNNYCQYFNVTCAGSSSELILPHEAFHSWSAQVDFTIDELGIDSNQNARLIFGADPIAYDNGTALAPNSYWFLEADASTDIWAPRVDRKRKLSISIACRCTMAKFDSGRSRVCGVAFDSRAFATG